MTDGARPVALVTGASRGLGLAMAEALAASGHDLVLAARDTPSLHQAVQRVSSLGARTTAHVVDVGEPDAVADMIRHVDTQVGPLQVLVNNAGIFLNGTVEQSDVESWERLMRVNALSALIACREAVTRMRPRGIGRIVNVASTSGVVGVPGAASYAMSKAALVGLTRALAVEVARTGITVNAVAPGMFHTDMTDEFRATPERESWALGTMPMRRWGAPQELGKAVAYLASTDAGFITGQVLAVDGGWTAT